MEIKPILFAGSETLATLLQRMRFAWDFLRLFLLINAFNITLLLQYTLSVNCTMISMHIIYVFLFSNSFNRQFKWVCFPNVVWEPSLYTEFDLLRVRRKTKQIIQPRSTTHVRSTRIVTREWEPPIGEQPHEHEIYRYSTREQTKRERAPESNSL